MVLFGFKSFTQKAVKLNKV